MKLNGEVFEIIASILTETPPYIQVSKVLSEEPSNCFYRFVDWVRVRKIFEKYVSCDVFLLVYLPICRSAANLRSGAILAFLIHSL